MNKSNYKRFKQERKTKIYHGYKKINHTNNTEIGKDTDSLMSEHIAEIAQRKKPPKRLPNMNIVFGK